MSFEPRDYGEASRKTPGPVATRVNVLTISGSVRLASSNARALDAIALLAPAGWTVRRGPSVDALPFFNPDVEARALQDSARAWRASIAACDALVISTPEYAHGLPGALKNALDWLVGGIEIIRKPIALVNATPPADYAQAQLRETLRVMGGDVIDEACIELPMRGTPMSAEDVARDAAMAEAIQRMVDAIRQSTRT